MMDLCLITKLANQIEKEKTPKRTVEKFHRAYLRYEWEGDALELGSHRALTKIAEHVIQVVKRILDTA